MPNTCKLSAGFPEQRTGAYNGEMWGLVRLATVKVFPPAQIVPAVSGSWGGNGFPSRRRLAGLGGRPATLELKKGPDPGSGQQWGILDNGRKPDPAMSPG
jgi:hypothetical protein